VAPKLATKFIDLIYLILLLLSGILQPLTIRKGISCLSKLRLAGRASQPNQGTDIPHHPGFG
jgi:hypothetical protein